MDATDSEVEVAAVLADIHDTILSFPDKVAVNTHMFLCFFSLALLSTRLSIIIFFERVTNNYPCAVCCDVVWQAAMVSLV